MCIASSDEEDEESPGAPAGLIQSVNQDLMQKMYILRFRLLHFVNSLHNYIMTRVSIIIEEGIASM